MLLFTTSITPSYPESNNKPAAPVEKVEAGAEVFYFFIYLFNFIFC